MKTKRNDKWSCVLDNFAYDFGQEEMRKGTTCEHTGRRFDAGESVLLARQLRYVMSKFYGKHYQKLRMREFFPINSEVPAGKLRVEYDRLEQHGEFLPYSPDADDIPYVTNTVIPSTTRIAVHAGAFGWDIVQLQRAAFSENYNLPMEGIKTLMTAAERRFELLNAQGAAEYGITGWYTDANIPAYIPPTGTWTAPATAVQIYEDIIFLLEGIYQATDDIFEPNILLVPSNRFEYLDFMHANTELTVMKRLQNRYPGLKIERYTRSNTYDVAGTGPRLLAGNTSRDVGEMMVAEEVTPEAAQRNGMKWNIVAHAQWGGVQLRQPIAYGIMDGI